MEIPSLLKSCAISYVTLAIALYDCFEMKYSIELNNII